MKVLYQTAAKATGGRAGTTSVLDGTLNLALSTPRELGGSGGEGTNPEQLFASGYAACFLSALQFVASRAKQRLPEAASVTVTVGIGPRDDGTGFALDIALNVDLPGIDHEVASALMQQAHLSCPYSHLARNGSDVRLSLA
ncbi:organic hydroperoxide resistance protein [Fertoebacter nigrum]|uniref:Organic hydroperoxide resistance protein n=1 Tax=Fertoeibacter niger TaxID=2656921 RepID=A0A8X8H275_9RHOB|nr:organic hydroperoxide resistance protein [Fertoeibacter niger]NUB45911.1 organic hydroperoxide resistance protein [Fertoeibacter niger]